MKNTRPIRPGRGTFGEFVSLPDHHPRLIRIENPDNARPPVFGRLGESALDRKAWVIFPDETQRIGQDRPAVLGVVPFFADDELVLIPRELQRGREILVGDEPAPGIDVEIVDAVLKEYADRFRLSFADERRGKCCRREDR